jgi:hypothetical protein
MSASSPAPPVPHRLQDFPDWVPAMLVKELRQGMRATMFVTPFIAVQFMAALAVAFEAQTGSGGGVASVFWLVAFSVVSIIMPFRGFAALREESDGGNSALLMLGGLSRWQIVMGKWLVQMVLNGLTLLSLLPYMLVRYFLGGFEIIPNLLMTVNVLFASAGISACIIGASGYRPVPLRFIIAAIGSFWVLFASSFLFAGIAELEKGTNLIWDLKACLSGLCAVGVQALYTITGMQLGRAHLKLYLLPYEIAPTRSVVALLIFMPFILLAGGIGTLFYGAPLVIAIIIWSMIRYDSPWRPKKGRRPQHISGMDTGWRPLS